ncbi:choline dehydrogenase [Klebsiella michiganensis]|nr:choline dehydrogenase [Klebsiella michiganensis]
MASVKQENCANGLKKAYDVIVVGGGSAGAVLAARLSENPDCQVALLEGGPVFTPDAWPDELAQSHSVGGGDYVWERGVATGTDHTAGHLRAKVLGGGSTINAGAFVRAPKSDFDRWVKRGLSDWSFDKVLPWFKRLEKRRLWRRSLAWSPRPGSGAVTGAGNAQPGKPGVLSCLPRSRLRRR